MRPANARDGVDWHELGPILPQRDGQGPDLGKEYRSAIFYLDEAQKQVAGKLIAEREARGMNIATEVAPAGRFWPAEDYHQDWYRQKGVRPGVSQSPAALAEHVRGASCRTGRRQRRTLERLLRASIP